MSRLYTPGNGTWFAMGVLCIAIWPIRWTFMQAYGDGVPDHEIFMGGLLTALGRCAATGRCADMATQCLEQPNLECVD